MIIVTPDSFLYLLEMYWPFLLGAALVGLATGWFAYPVARR